MEWISVKNRLPEDKQYVLSWDGHDIYIYKFIQTTDKRHKKRSGYFDCDEYSEEITHWMPLPQPPESNELNELNEA